MERTTQLMAVSKGLESRAKVTRPVGCWIRNHMIQLIFSNPRLIHRHAWYKGMTQIV
jgi:hypothetical protein